MKKEYSRFESSNFFEGIISLRALINAMTDECIKNDRKIIRVFYDRDRAEKEKKEFAWLTHRSEELGFEIEITSSEKIEEMALGNTHGGIIIEAAERKLSEIESSDILKEGFYIILDGIEDPYNFGYALRSLYASGVDGVILGKRNWMSAAGVVCRSSAGASELMNVYTSSDMVQTINLLKSKGYRVVCADIDNSVSLYECDLSTPILIVVGGEKRGISRAVLSCADQIVRIDYGREFPSALSAASASTVIGFEVLRQRPKNK